MDNYYKWGSITPQPKGVEEGTCTQGKEAANMRIN